MNMMQLQSAVEIGLIYSILAIAVFLSFRVLNFPDLTVDGSFPLGAAVAATSISSGMNPILATLLAFCVGAGAGYVTAFMSTRLKIFGLLAGILNMSALYSINLRIMGNKPNISLINKETIFQSGDNGKIYVLLGIVAFVVVVVSQFMGSQIGLAIRATGNNPRMAQAQGINDARMIALGLSISNGLVALAGALFCQSFGFADVSVGVGTIIIGLASVILGESVGSVRRISGALIAVVVGAIVYRTLIAFALNASEIGLQPSDLNFISAVLITVFMGVPTFKKMLTKMEVVNA